MLTNRNMCRFLYLSAIVFCISFVQTSRAQVAGEYFWNEDPGIGRATHVIAGSVDDYTTFDISADNIPSGINILGFRAFSNGRWTNTVTYFVLSPVAPEETDWRAEYFWDTDPGLGKGMPLNADLGLDGGIMEVDIPSEGLAPGEHILGVRTFSGRAWSQTVTSSVLVTDPRQSAITGLEYFWDTDPGLGNATPLEATLGPDGGLLDVDIPTDGLAPGEHLLGIRSRTEYAWSPTVTSSILIADPSLYEITGAEYFWGEDPGLGMATPIEITPGLEVAVDDLELDFPSEKAEQYVLSFRACTEKGWGLTHTVVLPHLYVESIELSAERDWIVPGETLAVEAKVNPEDSFNAELVWTSDNPEVATVDSNGVITGVSFGNAVITATSTDGTDVTGNYNILVTEPRARSLAIVPTELEMNIGDTRQLQAVIMPEDASRELEWRSLDESVVSVDQEGNIEALGIGSTAVVASTTDGSELAAECKVTVHKISGVDEADAAAIFVSVRNGSEIIITGADEEARVLVTSVSGTLVYDGIEKRITGLAPGVYIVAVDKTVAKVIIR